MAFLKSDVCHYPSFFSSVLFSLCFRASLCIYADAPDVILQVSDILFIFFHLFFFFLFFRLCTFDCSIFRWRFIYFFSAISNLPLSPSRKYFISDCFYFFTLDFAFGIFVEFILFIDITFMLKHFRVFYNSLKIVSFDYLNLGVIAVLKSATSISRPIGENFYHLVLFLSMVHILLFLYMSLFFSFLLETEPFYNILQHLGILIFF